MPIMYVVGMRLKFGIFSTLDMVRELRNNNMQFVFKTERL